MPTPAFWGAPAGPCWEAHIPAILGWHTAVDGATIRPVTTTIVTTPVDDAGLLLHADDAIAQACLTVMRLMEALTRRGSSIAAVVAVRVHAVDPAGASDLVDVVAEELVRRGVAVPIDVVDAGILQPGMLVGLAADVRVTDRPTPQREGETI